MKWLVLYGIIFCFTLTANAQVKHNFDMEPEKTDCHKLHSPIDNPDSALITIQHATFRLHESMTISSYRVPNKVDYYSCDGEIGYFVAKEDSSTIVIYENIPIKIWEAFNTTNDPLYFYQEEIKKKYKGLTAKNID